MSVKVNVEQLRDFERPLLQMNQAYIDVLHATKACQEAIGEGTGIEEAIERNGIALEKSYNDEVITAAQTVLSTLAASADNAEEIRKVMGSFESANTSAVADAQVTQGTRSAAFKRG